MLNKVRVKVSGKINLSLNITGKRGPLHTLDSVVASLSVYDTITVRDRLDDKVNLIFNADYSVEDNSVLRAVEILRRSLGNFGVDIVVDKHIPFAGGMGGSSADGAGVIAALDALFDLSKRGIDLVKVCGEVGADTLYMLSGGYARMTGTGDLTAGISCNRSYGVVYTECGGVMTADVYKAFDALGGDEPTDNDRLCAMLGAGEEPILGNMLLRAATSLCPRIAQTISAYRRLGLSPNMTGSGSTVYAICDDPMRETKRLAESGLCSEYAFTQKAGIVFE